MDPQIIFGTLGALAFILIIISLFKRRSVKKFLKDNKEVPQLYLQKAVDNKIRTLNKAMRETAAAADEHGHDEAFIEQIGQEYNRVKEAYKSNEISLKAYDANLDRLIRKLQDY